LKKNKNYVEIAQKRIVELQNGKLKLRAINKPIHTPKPTDKIAKTPIEWMNEA
jgi:hypothetical protein